MCLEVAYNRIAVGRTIGKLVLILGRYIRSYSVVLLFDREIHFHRV